MLVERENTSKIGQKTIFCLEGYFASKRMHQILAAWREETIFCSNDIFRNLLATLRTLRLVCFVLGSSDGTVYSRPRILIWWLLKYGSNNRTTSNHCARRHAGICAVMRQINDEHVYQREELKMKHWMKEKRHESFAYGTPKIWLNFRNTTLQHSIQGPHAPIERPNPHRYPKS